MFDKIDVDKKGYIIKSDMNTFNTGFIQNSTYSDNYSINDNWEIFFNTGQQSIALRYFVPDSSTNEMHFDIDDFGLFVSRTNFKYNLKDNNGNFLTLTNNYFRIRNELIDLQLLSCEVYQKSPRIVEILFNNLLLDNAHELVININTNDSSLNIIEKNKKK